MSKIPYVILAGLLASASIAQDRLEGHDRRGLSRSADAVTTLRATLDDGVIDACLMCHRGQLSLADRNPEELSALIASMSDGRTDHLVPMPELSDADREVLAEALAGVNP